MEATAHQYDTGILNFLRRMLEQIPMLRVASGEIPRLRIVIDANEVVSAILHRLQRPERGKPLLDELMRSSVLEVHAPRWLEIELQTVIPKVAAEMGFTAQALWKEFEDYRTTFCWDDTLHAPGTTGCDPKDVPYIELAEKIDAVGIYTNDPHIAKLGGHPLDRGFIVASRDYARSAAKSIGSRAVGLFIPVGAFLAVIGTVVALAKGFARLPVGMRVAAISALGLALAIPKSRRWLADTSVLLWSLAQEATPPLFRLMSELTGEADREKPATDSALAAVTKLTRTPRRRVTPAAAARRAPRRPVTVQPKGRVGTP